MSSVQGVHPVKLKVKEYRLEGQNIPQTVKNFLQRMLNPETYASVYDGNVLVIEAIKKEGTNSSAPSIARDNPATDKYLLAPSEISVKELLSLVKGDAGKYVPMSKSQQVQALTAVAHTPQERLALDRYKNAVKLLENRSAILSKTRNQLQQLESTGRTGSAEYNKLKSAEITLSRKVDEAQRKVDRVENGTSIRGLREKAENNSGLEKSNAAQYNVNKIADVRITAPGISQVLDYDRKTRKWTQLEDLQAVNPKFNQSTEYKLNCQRCVPAYELRRRGYRVTAKPATLSSEGKLSKEDILVKNNVWFSGLFKGIQWISGGTGSGIEQVKKAMSKWGNNARAEVYVQWINGGSHVFVAEMIDGKIVFIDPQSGSGDYEKCFERVKSGRTLFARIDNLELTDVIDDCVYNGR